MFRRLLPLLAAFLVAVTLLASRVEAQAMVQLSFTDLVRKEGAPLKNSAPLRLELELGGMIEGNARQVKMDLQLAPGTTAADLAELVSKRFERAGFDVLAPSVDRRGKLSRGTLFVQDALLVKLRLMGPVRGSLTTCEGPPKSLRVRAPAAHALAGRLLLSGTAKHPQKESLELIELEVPLRVGDHPAQISERLHAASMKLGLLSERPGGDAWQPVRTTKGAAVQGLTVLITGGGDWLVELELPSK